jgi:hypothetical protein
MNACKRCAERGRPEYFGSEPVCAFPNGNFVGHNWQCATANELRRISELGSNGVFSRAGFFNAVRGVQVGPLLAVSRRLDDQSASMLFSQDSGWVFMSWHKNRGATDMIMSDSGTPLLTTIAEKLIDSFSGIKEEED